MSAHGRAETSQENIDLFQKIPHFLDLPGTYEVQHVQGHGRNPTPHVHPRVQIRGVFLDAFEAVRLDRTSLEERLVGGQPRHSPVQIPLIIEINLDPGRGGVREALVILHHSDGQVLDV